MTLEQRHLDRKRSPAEWIGGSMCDDLKRCAVMQRTCISFTCRVPCLPLPSMVLENCSEKLGCDVGLPVPEEFCAGWRLNRPIMPLTPPVLCQAVMSTLSRRNGDILVPNLNRQDGREAVTLLQRYETPHIVVEYPHSKCP